MQDPGLILIIDPDPVSRQALGTCLHGQRLRAGEAAGGREALEAIEAHLPVLLLLDANLPDMSSEDFLGILRHNEATRVLPVILLGGDDAAGNGTARYADDCLRKPVGERELLESVIGQLRKRRPRAALANGRTGVNARPVLYGYHLLDIVAEGGGQTVFLARHTPTQQQVVIKTLPIAAQGERGGAARFLREGDVLSRIAHPNVVRERGHGISGEHAYVVTEFIGGGSLRQLLGKAWHPIEALRLIGGVARALGAVHAASLVHRDVKPENVLLRGDTLEPVLLDFGLARTYRGRRRVERETGDRRAARVLGTPAYMAPELIQGTLSGPACDIYACGVMLYELLTGTRPFCGAYPSEVLRRHLRDPVPLLPDSLSLWQPLISDMLAKDPALRPADGTVLGSRLVALGAAMSDRTGLDTAGCREAVTGC